MKIDVKHVAKLANLPLTDEELPVFEKQLSEILAYVALLEQVINISNVEPTSQTTGLENITREDTTKDSLSQKDALSNAKSENGNFAVKAIFE